MSGILWLLLLLVFMSDILKTVLNLFLRLPFSRRNEMEADYIGLLLMASAGYDPQVAPQVYYTFEGRSRSPSDDYLSTHPHGKRRAQLLSEPKVMEEALSMYKEALKEGEDCRPMSFFNRFMGWSCCCEARRRNSVQVPLAEVADVIRPRFCRENAGSLRV